ncbi:MAG: metallophosphoesterase [Spirosomataceae bacterium]
MKLISLFLAGFLLFSISFLKAQTIERHPYLQQPTQKSMGIQWRFSDPSNGAVRYYSVNNPGVTFEKKNDKIQKDHFLVLTDLTPNSSYRYEVKGNNGVWQSHPDYFFRTAPSDINQKIRIWAMGDFGDLRKQDYVRTQTGVRDTHLKTKDKHTDLWLWLGDMSYGNNKDYLMQTGVFDFFGPKILSNTPIVTVPGNHEYYENNVFNRLDSQIVYFDLVNPPVSGEANGLPSYNKSYYSMRYGPLHIIALNSYGKENGKLLYDTDSKQYQWLKKELEHSKDALWKVVILHHPPYTKRSHDSDAEQELVQIRQALVPLFDVYHIDLVLTGHSHVYERSHLMANHLGHSSEFLPATHIKQNVTGRYTSTEPPYINKKEGTIYCVVGSGGRLELPARSGESPHPTSVYSQIEVGGSLLFTIENNRLDAQWTASTGEIMDQFTVFKNVNSTIKKKIIENEVVTLEASWPGSYRWSHNSAKTKKIQLQTDKNIQITVTDSLGYLKDVFEIEVEPLPPLKTVSSLLQPKSFYCPLDTLTISTKMTHSRPGLVYKLQLSDKNGNFEQPSLETTWSTELMKVSLPNSIQISANYKFRVIPMNFTNFESISTDPIQVYKPLQVTTVSPSQIPYNSTIDLTFQSEGSLPGRGLINATIPVTIDKQNQAFQVTVPSNSMQYELTEIRNQCGLGVVDKKKVTVLAPLQAEPSHTTEQWVIFPNPTEDKLYLQIPKNTSDYSLKLVDISGISTKMTAEKVTDSLLVLNINQLASGKYILEIQSGAQIITKTFIKLD